MGINELVFRLVFCVYSKIKDFNDHNDEAKSTSMKKLVL